MTSSHFGVSFFTKIASVRTEETAWKLLDRLRPAAPFNELVLVQRQPGQGADIAVLGGLHPDDEKALQAAVRAFRSEFAPK